MKKSELENFETIWEKSLQEPNLIQADVKKREIDLSLTTILDRFMALAEKSFKQNKIKKMDYDELINQTNGFKKILAKINDKAIISNEMTECIKQKTLKF